jgi:hypothetical protein
MKHNISMMEVIIRLIIAMGLALTAWLSGYFIFFPLGMIMVVTALSGYCPLYGILGKDTSDH